jgi:hypothetical protein
MVNWNHQLWMMEPSFHVARQPTVRSRGAAGATIQGKHTAMAQVSPYSLVMPQGRPTAVRDQVPALQVAVRLVPWLGLVQVATQVPPCGVPGQDQAPPAPGLAAGFPVQPVVRHNT